MLPVFILRKLCQRGLGVEQGCDELAITHAESLQNGFDVTSLMHGNDARPSIPLEMDSKEEMQLAEVTHLEFPLEARLQLLDYVHIVAKMMKSSTYMITIIM